MKRLMRLAMLGVLLFCAAPRAEEPPRTDPLAEHVLPPELILQHQKAIGLTDSQKNAIIAEVKRVQGRLVDVQWELQRAVQQMVELIGKERPDEAAVAAQLDKVLAVEREIKLAHVTLAVRLKHILTPEQQKTLRELRAASPRR